MLLNKLLTPQPEPVVEKHPTLSEVLTQNVTSTSRLLCLTNYQEPWL
jgi:hypothetical protein